VIAAWEVYSSNPSVFVRLGNEENKTQGQCKSRRALESKRRSASNAVRDRRGKIKHEKKTFCKIRGDSNLELVLLWKYDILIFSICSLNRSKIVVFVCVCV
jgi:hypothetical protein